MSKFSEWIQKNSYAVVGMFVFSVFIGIVTLLGSWKTLYTDYLSNVVLIPIWLLIIILVAIGFLLLARATPKQFEFNAKPKVKITDEKFSTQHVVLDDKHFKLCTFENCQLIINGEAPIGLEKCTLINCQYVFGKYAANFISLLHLMRSDESFRPTFDALIASLETGNFPTYTPPNSIIKNET